MDKIKENFEIFNLSGFCYIFVEMAWRGYSHWTMFFTGGICFLILVRLFQAIKNRTLIEKCVYGALVITTVEFTIGCIVNLWLKMNVWNYSNMPFNILGQVCLLYSVLWGVLSIPIVYLTGNKNRKEDKDESSALNDGVVV